eukprot:gnl/MRDRNA2_/MRDRNA2_113804_c0_seq1.p1 gnl/MRDRNA2_/MRDRNA2_113804_c0~~gnl/MRDRNA2_/MRDRNA2_113804_c0_seq1.p1  ORF type:complete len:102 (-),score=13.69 gnl/MRDRNA2_/MRDRNA2_113804_c0_seq1:238-543(-)
MDSFMQQKSFGAMASKMMARSRGVAVPMAASPQAECISYGKSCPTSMPWPESMPYSESGGYTIGKDIVPRAGGEMLACIYLPCMAAVAGCGFVSAIIGMIS